MTTQEQQPAQPAPPPASRPAALAASAEPGSAIQGTPLKLCHFCGGEWPEGQGDAVQKWNWLATRASAPAASAEPVAWEYFSTIEQRWCPADPDRVEILQRTHKVRALTTVSPPAAAERTQVDNDLVSSLLRIAEVAPASECEILQGAAAALANAPVGGEVQPVELRAVTETIKEGDGFWRSCTGCHELNEGHDTGPYSAVLQCHLGNGCSECGGIGAIWDNTDYQAMGDAMARDIGQSVAPQASPAAQPPQDFGVEMVSMSGTAPAVPRWLLDAAQRIQTYMDAHSPGAWAVGGIQKRQAPAADGRDAKDAARLDFLADQDAQIQSLTLDNGTKYRIGWPDPDEAQSEWFGSPREAIDAAIAAQQGEGGWGMSLNYIRDTYGVPAKRGARVEYTGNGCAIQGTITSSRGAHLMVRLDGHKFSNAFHPTWKIRYLDAAQQHKGDA